MKSPTFRLIDLESTYRTLFCGPQHRKFAIRSAFDIVSAGQRRPHSRGHRRPKCIQHHTTREHGADVSSDWCSYCDCSGERRYDSWWLGFSAVHGPLFLPSRRDCTNSRHTELVTAVNCPARHRLTHSRVNHTPPTHRAPAVIDYTPPSSPWKSTCDNSPRGRLRQTWFQKS